MTFVNRVSDFVNYHSINVDRLVKKIAINPSAAKKVLQIASKMLAAFDLYHFGKVRDHKITDAMKGATELIEFYGTYKNLMYWVNLFSRENLDEKAVQESLESSLCASHRSPNDIKTQKKIAGNVFQEVVNRKEYHSKGEVLDVLRKSLQKYGYKDEEKVNAVAARVIIQQNLPPLIQRLSMVCFTITDLGSNIMVLKKWDILDLAGLAASIGGQSRVFLFVANIGFDTVLGAIASAGLLLVVGEAAYRAIAYGTKYYDNTVDLNERAKAYQELRNALLDALSAGTDLVCAATPLVFTLNPPVIVALALIAKGTGLVSILIR